MSDLTQERREAVALAIQTVLCDELGLHPDEAADSIPAFLSALDALSPKGTDEAVRGLDDYLENQAASAETDEGRAILLEWCGAVRSQSAEISRLQALTPKEGFVVVPVEPTEAMMDAGMKKLIHGGAYNGLKNAFRAMAAAPRPTTKEGA